MIGLALHLAARGLDTVRAEMAEARSLLGWGLAFVALGRGTPDPSEVEQLGAECDQLRKERGEARAQLADAQTLAHEAKLEFSAARETCEQLRAERDQLREAARALRDLRVSPCRLCGRLATRQVGIKFEGDRATHCYLICDFCSPDRACSSQGALVEWRVDLNAAAVVRPLLAAEAPRG